ncbi:hypothetical protein N0V94_008899 [Neodidymelliopsis sp. IMI 364377]|nr:hypothetical protein N0V94_008899 [Neodidymelliopsis sp. IMI 364377]
MPHDTCAPAFLALNCVLKNPEEKKTAFQIGHHSAENFSTWLEAHPIQHNAFHRFVQAQSSSLPTWLSAVPFNTEDAQNTTTDDIVFVSVNGGNGAQCALLKQTFPNLQGRIILQDQPAVLASAPSVPGMETMAHDFMAEQPVHGSLPFSLSLFLPR